MDVKKATSNQSNGNFWGNKTSESELNAKYRQVSDCFAVNNLWLSFFPRQHGWHAVPSCTTLHHTVPHCTTQWVARCTTPYQTVAHCTTLYHTMGGTLTFAATLIGLWKTSNWALITNLTTFHPPTFPSFPLGRPNLWNPAECCLSKGNIFVRRKTFMSRG